MNTSNVVVGFGVQDRQQACFMRDAKNGQLMMRADGTAHLLFVRFGSTVLQASPDGSLCSFPVATFDGIWVVPANPGAFITINAQG
jgi:hypothetical protein